MAKLKRLYGSLASNYKTKKRMTEKGKKMTSGDGVKYLNLQGGGELVVLKRGERSCKQHQVEHWKTMFKKISFGNFKVGGRGGQD